MSEIEFPYVRDQVIDALQSLASARRQERWGVVEEGVNYYDDLDLVVHVLYDDASVLPRPGESVGTIIYLEEVPAFSTLGDIFSAMIADLGDVKDEVYLADSRWNRVMECAASVLQVMESCDSQ